MTGFANVSGIWMIPGFTQCNSAVMTTHAGANDFIVIQRCDEINPCCWRNAMACLADISRIWMVGRFTGGNNTIMTTDTGPYYLCMV